MKQIIFDADNTMGVSGCNVDDGLALLYLLAHPKECKVIALTCSYGNSDVETVYKNTCRLAEKLNLDIPVLKGAAGPDDEEPSEAAVYLAEQAALAPDQISVLATGPLTNLKQAAQVDPDFYRNLHEVSVMGGITETLMVNGKNKDERNLSCDPEAALGLLEASCPVAVATSQACLPCYCTREFFMQQVGRRSWLGGECDPWFIWMEETYDADGAVFWDVVAAAVLISAEHFDFSLFPVSLNPRLLAAGYLEKARGVDVPQRIVEIPVIMDPDDFVSACLDAWALFAKGAAKGKETGDAGLFGKVKKLFSR